MDISFGQAKPETILIELFEDICPKTCANFSSLCKGFTREDKEKLSYVGCDFDRIVKGKFIQGGNIRKTVGK